MCVFEPRIDVLEKLVAELKTTVEQRASESATRTAAQSTSMARVMDLLESLRTEQANLASCVGLLQQQLQSSSTDGTMCKGPVTDTVKRPTLMPPPPPLQRCGANYDYESPVRSSPVNIPHANPLVVTTKASTEESVTSPAWFPVSAEDSTAYHDAYSSDDDDRSATMGGPRMLDA